MYDTVSAVWTRDQKRLANACVDYVTFGSPSAVQGWVDNGGPITLPSFVIGKRTLKYAQKLGFNRIIGYNAQEDVGSDNNVLRGWSQFILRQVAGNKK